MVESDKRVVVIAGMQKEALVLAALQSKLFKVWITDEVSLRKVLNLAEAEMAIRPSGAL